MADVDAPLVVLKLGGSLITLKQEHRREVFEDGLREAAAQAAHLKEQLQGSGIGLAVIHGAGSFGHDLVAEYDLHKGGKPGVNTTELAMQCSLVRESVRQLHRLVLSALAEAGIAADGISPFDVGCRTCRDPALGLSPTAQDVRCIVQSSTTSMIGAVRASLSAGRVPVLHGDLVHDDAQRCAVLSGDTLLPLLARCFPTRAIITLSDVPGILASAPTAASREPQPQPPLLRCAVVSHRVSAHEGASMRAVLQAESPGSAPRLVEISSPVPTSTEAGTVAAAAAAASDVTGGMHGKVLALMDAAAAAARDGESAHPTPLVVLAGIGSRPTTDSDVSTLLKPLTAVGAAIVGVTPAPAATDESSELATMLASECGISITAAQWLAAAPCTVLVSR